MTGRSGGETEARKAEARRHLKAWADWFDRGKPHPSEPATPDIASDRCGLCNFHLKHPIHLV